MFSCFILYSYGSPCEQFYLEHVKIIFSKTLKIFVHVMKFSENRILKKNLVIFNK